MTVGRTIRSPHLLFFSKYAYTQGYYGHLKTAIYKKAFFCKYDFIDLSFVFKGQTTIEDLNYRKINKKTAAANILLINSAPWPSWLACFLSEQVGSILD